MQIKKIPTRAVRMSESEMSKIVYSAAFGGSAIGAFMGILTLVIFHHVWEWTAKQIKLISAMFK